MGGGRDVRTSNHGVGTSDREIRGGYGEGMQRTNGCLPGIEPGMRHAIPHQVEAHAHFASFFTKPVNRVNTVYEVHVNP